MKGYLWPVCLRCSHRPFAYATAMAWGIAGCLIGVLSGCGPSAAQRWSDLPNEEQHRLTAENLAGGEIHVALADEDSPATRALPKGTAYRAFGEVRLKDPKASRLGGAMAKVYELRSDGKKPQLDQWAFQFKEREPGMYTFEIPLQPVAKPGQ